MHRPLHHGIWEPTFMASYERLPTADFALHCGQHYFHLLPLVIDAASRYSSRAAAAAAPPKKRRGMSRME